MSRKETAPVSSVGSDAEKLHPVPVPGEEENTACCLECFEAKRGGFYLGLMHTRSQRLLGNAEHPAPVV